MRKRNKPWEVRVDGFYIKIIICIIIAAFGLTILFS